MEEQINIQNSTDISLNTQIPYRQKVLLVCSDETLQQKYRENYPENSYELTILTKFCELCPIQDKFNIIVLICLKTLKIPFLGNVFKKILDGGFLIVEAPVSVAVSAMLTQVGFIIQKVEPHKDITRETINALKPVPDLWTFDKNDLVNI